MTRDTRDQMQMTDEEIRRRQRSRNIAVALSVAALVVVIFFVSIIRIQAGIDAGEGG